VHLEAEIPSTFEGDFCIPEAIFSNQTISCKLLGKKGLYSIVTIKLDSSEYNEGEATTITVYWPNIKIEKFVVSPGIFEGQEKAIL
jgi:hypothetical protein